MACTTFGLKQSAEASEQTMSAMPNQSASRTILRPCEHALQREDLADLQVRAAQFADEFLPFGHEQSVFRASAFVGQRADELYFGFRHRCFSMVKVTPSVAG